MRVLEIRSIKALFGWPNKNAVRLHKTECHTSKVYVTKQLLKMALEYKIADPTIETFKTNTLCKLTSLLYTLVYKYLPAYKFVKLS